MGDIVDLGDYRDQKEREEIEELQDKLKEHIENQPPPSHDGYFSPLEDMLKDDQFSTEEDSEPAPEPEISTSRWDHFLKLIDALWLAFRHLWRVIWGPNYEIFH